MLEKKSKVKTKAAKKKDGDDGKARAKAMADALARVARQRKRLDEQEAAREKDHLSYLNMVIKDGLERYRQEQQAWADMQERAAALAETQRRIREEQAAAVQDMRREYASYATMVGMTIHDQITNALLLQQQINQARKDGNAELLADLQQQEQHMLTHMLAATLDQIAQIAMAKGTVMLIEGIATGAANLIAGGGALMAFGAAGATGSALMAGATTTGGTSTLGGESMSMSAPTAPAGVGAQSTGGVTEIHNYYFGGPVFGNADDTARYVAQMNARGQLLEGMAA